MFFIWKIYKKKHCFEVNLLFIMIHLMKSTTLKPSSAANEQSTSLKLKLMQNEKIGRTTIE